MTLAAEFPPLSHIVNWPPFFDNALGINKIVMIYAMAAALTILIFTLGRKGELVPTGAQNFAEITVEFVQDGIVMETIGEKGLKYTPLLLSLFFFIFFCNITGIIPVLQMPATARIALPMFLAIFAYVIYHGAGVREHGPFGYLKHATMPPGLPKALYLLVTPIEFIIKFIVTPFTHTVRLFANLLAGHILLVTFAVLSSALWALKPNVIILPLPFFALIAFIAFEILVSFLQAYVFTLLTGVYIGQAISHEH
jgi:F-type H+-transporting ATPase subunit a